MNASGPALFLLFCGPVVSGLQAADNDLYARVILFLPEDTEPPEKYEERIASLAVRAETFFAHWMKHWKRPIERKQIFARNADGVVNVTTVHGQVKAKGRAALPEIRQQAIDRASQQLSLKPNQPTVWWILYDYPDVRGFQGGARGIGGVAINAYPAGTELIGKDAELASPELAEMAIKGTIHEFGHALGLPHIGPRPGLDLGNSLMGPIIRSYRGRTGSNDARVHLSEVAAATIQKHPIFQNQAVALPKMPQAIRIADLEVSESGDHAEIVVQGVLKANAPAHTAVLLDSERSQFGDYWARPYAATVDPKTGEFKIAVSEPFPKGTLYLSFCFENGVSTADGRKSLQRGSAVEITYKGEKGSRTFDISR